MKAIDKLLGWQHHIADDACVICADTDGEESDSNGQDNDNNSNSHNNGKEYRSRVVTPCCRRLLGAQCMPSWIEEKIFQQRAMPCCPQCRSGGIGP
jgi:hypothetical protein